MEHADRDGLQVVQRRGSGITRERARVQVRGMIDGRQSVIARYFDNTLLTLVAVSLLTLLIDTVLGARLPASATAAIEVCNVVLPVLFTAEYLLRLWAAESRRKFALSFSGVIMLLSVLPFWLALGASEELRLFQFLTRIRRVFILARAVDLLRVRGLPARIEMPALSSLLHSTLASVTSVNRRVRAMRSSTRLAARVQIHAEIP